MESIIYSLSASFIEFTKIITAVRLLLEIRTGKHKKAMVLFPAFALFSVVFSTFTNDHAMAGGFLATAYCLMADNKKDRINIIITFIFICLLNMASDLIILQGDLSSYDSPAALPVKLIPLLVILICALIKKLYQRYHPDLYRYLKFLLPALIFTAFIFIVHFYIMLNADGASYYSVEDFSFLGFGIGGIVILFLVMLLLKRHSEQLETNAQMAERLIESQKKYYTMLLQKEEDSRRFRHDIKNHLFCINSLFKEKKYDELGRYLAELDTRSAQLSRPFSTSSELVDIILGEICSEYPGVTLSITGVFPGEIKMTQFDQCTVFSNLFSNAFEAADKCMNKNVNVSIKALGQNLYMSVSNTYTEIPIESDMADESTE